MWTLLSSLASIRRSEAAGVRVIYGNTQPTLIPSWPELESLVVALGPFYTCAWCALERSVLVGAPVSADTSVVISLVEALKGFGVVAASGSKSGPVRRSLYEPVSWAYSEKWSLQGDFATTLIGVLDAWRRELLQHERQRLWQQLAEKEVYGYLVSLLRRHGFDPQKAESLLSQQGMEWERLSLGRKRYVIWSSFRSYSSEFSKSERSERGMLAVIAQDMQRRTQWLSSKESRGVLRRTEYCFLPDSTWRRPIMLDVALSHLLLIGDDYWVAPPMSAK